MENKSGCSSQLFSNEEEDLQSIELRERIAIKQLQLNQLANDHQKFTDHVVKLIADAKASIDTNEKQALKLGLIYLKECQRILEYAAGCGKNLPRELITITLHNQASIYQKLWQLKSCSSYLQGLIYNYDNFIRGSELYPKKDHFHLAIHNSIQNNKLKLTHQLAKYHLQFCAVNSQLMQHQTSLTSAEKAITLIKENIATIPDDFRRQFEKQYDNQVENIEMKLDILNGLAQLDDRIGDIFEKEEKQKNMLKSTHFSLQMWSQNTIQLQDYKGYQNNDYSSYLSNFSIGNIVEIVPIKCEHSMDNSPFKETDKQSRESRGYNKQSREYNKQSREYNKQSREYNKQSREYNKQSREYNKELSREYNTHQKIILLSACYFSKATQLRLKSLQMYKKHVEERKSSKQFKLSTIYHLVAICIVAIFIPFQLKYLKEILTSYEKHYSCNLMEYKTVEKESLKKIAEMLQIPVRQIIKNQNQFSTQKDIKATSETMADTEDKNQYNLNGKFEKNKKKNTSDKLKNLKKITKELTDSHRKNEEKVSSRSKESKTSLSISSNLKKQRISSKNQTLKKLPNYKQNSKQKQILTSKVFSKSKSKKVFTSPITAKFKEEKNKNKKQFVDETEELFFCFTKKTKKSQGVDPQSQLRSSLGSTSGKSKSPKKSILSPKNIKLKPVQKTENKKSPPKRKNVADNYYF